RAREPVGDVQGGGGQGAPEDDAGAAEARRHGARSRLGPDGGSEGLVLQPDQVRREGRGPEDHADRLIVQPSAESRGAGLTGGAPRPVLEIAGLRKAFGKREVLKGLDVSVRPGELAVVLGANGSGKSTLLRCALRLVEPDGGDVTLCGADLRSLSGEQLRLARRQAAMVFQSVLLVRRRTAHENVAFGGLGELRLHRSLVARTFPQDLCTRANDALERVGLARYADQRAGTLSGGQAQRVAIARALCQRARVILADEPVASLDPRAADSVM